MSAREDELRDLLRDATVRLDEQRRMTDAAEARFESAARRWEEADLRALRAEARLRRVEDLAEWHETKAEKARRFRPDEQIVVMDKAAEVHADAARRIRAALAEEDAR